MHIIMEQKRAPLFHLLLLLLGFACLLSLGYNVASTKREALVLNDFAHLDLIAGELPEAAEEALKFLHGRMDIESNDYTPSANNRHDPKIPRKG